MATITQISPQKSKKRVNIYLDNKFGFGIDLENLVKLGLKLNQELTENDIQKIVKVSEFQKTLDKLLVFVTIRPRSYKEVLNWLMRKKIHSSIHNDLFDRLNRLGFLDDNKFANWWIEQRNSFRPKSKRILELELRQKGISVEIIKSALQNIKVNESKDALKILEKKKRNFDKYDLSVRKNKMITFLIGKGYSFEISKSATNSILKLKVDQ